MKKYANLTAVIETAQPLIDDKVAAYKLAYKEEHERDPSELQVAMYERGLVAHFVTAFGRYIKDTDLVEVNSFKSGRAGVLVFDVTVTREGIAVGMITEMIVAGGHSVQCAHYRYISKTSLMKLNQPHPLIKKLQDERKRMDKRQRIEYDMNLVKRNQESARAGFQKMIAFTDEEILVREPLAGYTWENLDEFARQRWGSKEQFDTYIDGQRKQYIHYHRYRYNEKNYNKLLAIQEKELNKYIQKIAAL